jgi:hypothetical protein
MQDPNDQRRPYRRALNALLARLNVADLAENTALFVWQFEEFLEPNDEHEPIVYDDAMIIEWCEQLFDYFQLAGTWMKSMFRPDLLATCEPIERPYVLTEERWSSWQIRLRDIQRATSSDEVYARVQEVLDVMKDPENPTEEDGGDDYDRPPTPDEAFYSAWYESPPGTPDSNSPRAFSRAIKSFLDGELDKATTVSNLTTAENGDWMWETIIDMACARPETEEQLLSLAKALLNGEDEVVRSEMDLTLICASRTTWDGMASIIV